MELPFFLNVWAINYPFRLLIDTSEAFHLLSSQAPPATSQIHKLIKAPDVFDVIDVRPMEAKKKSGANPTVNKN